MTRTTRNLIFASAIAFAAASAADAGGITLHLSPGLWEITSSAKVSGAPPISEEMLAHIPPAQRAKILAMVQTSMAQAQQPHTVKSCVTQQDLDHPFHGMENHAGTDCSETVTSSSWTSQVVHIACKNGNSVTDGTFQFQTPTPTVMQGVLDMNIVSGSHTMNTKAQVQGHWLGTSCGSVKPSGY